MNESAHVRILGIDAAEATREAANLRQHLLASVNQEISASLAKDDPSTQDFGSTLVLVFGAPAVVAIAHGIAEWLKGRRIGSSIELEVDGARIKMSGDIADQPQQLLSLVAALRRNSADR